MLHIRAFLSRALPRSAEGMLLYRKNKLNNRGDFVIVSKEFLIDHEMIELMTLLLLRKVMLVERQLSKVI